MSSNLSSDLLSLHTVNHGYIGETEYPTTADLLAEIDNAISKRQPILIYGHVIATLSGGTSQTSIVEFQAIVDHVKMRYDQGLVDVKTISEFYNDAQRDIG